MEYRFPTPCYQPYDGNGNFTVDQPAFTSGTPISSSATNANNTDFADGLTNCVTKDGQSTPTASLPLANDGVIYASDPDTGLHRTAANTQALFVGGTDILTVNGGGMTVRGTAFSGVSGNPTLLAQTTPLVGEIRAYALTTIPTGWALCDGSALTATSPLRTALIAAGNPYGVSGSDPLLPDGRGRQLVGKDNMGGVAANRVTNAVSGITGTTLGATGGAQSVTIGQTNLPAVAPTFTGTLQSPSVTFGPSGALTFTGNSSTLASGGAGQSISGIATLTGTVSFTPAGTISNLGSGTALGKMDPTLIVNFIIFVGA